MTAVMFAIFILPVQSVLLITLLGFIGSVPLTAFSLMIDMAKPKLIWNKSPGGSKTEYEWFIRHVGKSFNIRVIDCCSNNDDKGRDILVGYLYNPCIGNVRIGNF